MYRTILVLVLLLPSSSRGIDAADRPIKVFILAGQSNMVGWGDSLKLEDDLRNGNGRVLMFENGNWQPLKPFQEVKKNQAKFGLAEFSFGPEIAFGHEIAKAWPDETIGIVKVAVGGTSILAWKPNWSKEDADRVGQGGRGPLYRKLIRKIEQAKSARDIDIVGFLWLQGGGDMKNVVVAREYLDNLKSLVTAVRKDTGIPDLPFYCGSVRRNEDPDDLTDLVPQRIDGRYPAVQWVIKAQWDVQKAIPNAHTVILRDIATHPMNVHYDTHGQLAVGRHYATAFLAANSAVPPAVEENITYGTAEGQELKLDLARPAGDGPFPAVAFIHGGGWYLGDREGYRLQIEQAAERGYVAVSMSYRLMKFDEAKKETTTATGTFPAQIHDAKAAIRWLRANAAKYDIDPDRIGVTGRSAGGHLSLLLGLTDAHSGLEGDSGNPDHSSRVQAVVNVFGPTDIKACYETSSVAWIFRLFMGGTPHKFAETYRTASPITWVSQDDPPVLTLHGSEDKAVPFAQAVTLDEKLKSAGGRHTLIEFEGQGHGFGGAHRQQELHEMWKFFDEQLRPSSVGVQAR
ncbi:MAG: sialate O-acetylesterase [Planctomycetaceae bacterium]